MYLEHSHLLHGVVLEERLGKCMLLTRWVVVGTLIDALPVVGPYREVVVVSDAVVGEFLFKDAVEFLEVDAVLERTVAGGVEDGINDFIHQALLVVVALVHDLLKRARKGARLVETVVRTLGEILVADSRGGAGFKDFEHASVFCRHLSSALDGSGVIVHKDGIGGSGNALVGIRALFDISSGFRQFELMGHTSKCAFH